jgi:redox-regulated HSP33 family molecular chaperone
VVKSTSETNVVGALQQDINGFTGTPSTSLTDVRDLTGPTTTPLQSANFQQQASIDYTAEVSTQQGTAPIIGVFSELLNTSNQLSAFIDFRQTSDASDQAADASGIMIQSML